MKNRRLTKSFTSLLQRWCSFSAEIQNVCPVKSPGLYEPGWTSSGNAGVKRLECLHGLASPAKHRERIGLKVNRLDLLVPRERTVHTRDGTPHQLLRIFAEPMAADLQVCC